jgi:hypothetical protein
MAAQVLALGHSGEEAAVLAGYNPSGSSFKANTRKFCNSKAIVRRVQEIQVEHGIAAKLTATQLIIEAEEARAGMISARTKAALAAAKRRGVKLGGDRGVEDLWAYIRAHANQ